MIDTSQPMDAGAQPAPAQLPKTLRELAEIVKDWGARGQAWPHADPDYDDVAQFGHISEDGEPYPVAEVNADTYGHEGVSLQLAQFYAAASPVAVLALLDRVELRDNELRAARADTKHWRSNHDNVVARLRIFTQRPDIPKELADRLPWYRELVRLQEVEAQALQQSAEITDAEIDRIAESMPGGLDGFLKAWGWRQFARAILQAAPPAPAAVAVPADWRELLEFWIAPQLERARKEAFNRGDGPSANGYLDALDKARAALAAAPAQKHATQLAGPVLHDIEAGVEVMAWLRENRAPHSIYSKMSACLFGDPDAPRAAPAQSQEDARDAERVEWAMNNMVVRRHSHAFAVHVLNRGGTGDLGDCRTYIDAARAAQGGAA